jgi:hypothetical protein
MPERLYLMTFRLVFVVLVFAACGGRDTAGTDRGVDSVAVQAPDNTNNYTVDRPPGDTNAMIKDSLYNADSAKHRPKKPRPVPEK